MPKPPPPDGGGPDVAEVAISSPTAGAVIAGAEPGTTFSVTGTAAGPAGTNLYLRVTVDGLDYPSSIDATGAWTATPRVYNYGLNNVTAEVTAIHGLGGRGTTASDMVNFTANLYSPSPVFRITVPAADTVIDLPLGGQSVPVEVTCNDTFGPRTFRVTSPAPDPQIPFFVPKPGVPGTYVGSARFPALPINLISLGVACSEPAGQIGTWGVLVTGRDITAPVVLITTPADTEIIGNEAGAATLIITGTASDTQSGMSNHVVGDQARVTLAVDAPDAVAAARVVAVGTGHGGATDLSSWTASIAVTGSDKHVIYVWGRDVAGNETPQPVIVEILIVKRHVATSLAERLDQRQYLAELVAFASNSLLMPNPAGGAAVPPDVTQIDAVLGQPVDLMSTALSPAAQASLIPVNELRVPIELLRHYLHDHSIAQSTASADAERGYLERGYASLLADAGTSYAELRLARSASLDQRTSLAARLGFRLSTNTPDQLTQLTLDPDQLTEAALESLFGLPATAPDLDQLRHILRGQLFNWQWDAQELDWAHQDQSDPVTRSYGAVLDPDVIGPADVTANPSGDPLGLLAARTQQLSAYLLTLQNLRSGKTDVNALQAVLTPELAAHLATLETAAAGGHDITTDLQAAYLTWPGFRYLLQMLALAPAGLTPAEWDDTMAILVAVHKHSFYSDWRTAEQATVLSPDNFISSADTGPVVNPWRSDPVARRDWQSTLRIRTVQRQNLLDRAASSVADTEQAALPLLRDALLIDIPATPSQDAGELMTTRLLTDVKISGSLRTTRIGSATEAVQSLLAGVRGGDLSPDSPVHTWSIRAEQLTAFDAAWAWMGSWDTWRAATRAFLFPEENLDPTLLGSVGVTDPFMTLYVGLTQPGKLTPETVTQAAANYVKGLSTISTGWPTQDGPWTYLLPRRDQQQQTRGDQASQRSSPTEFLGVDVGREAFWAAPMLIAQRLHAAGQYLAALDWLWTLYPYTDPTMPSISHLITAEGTSKATPPNLGPLPGWTAHLNPFELIALSARPAPYTRYTVLALARCHLDYADVEFTAETAESIAHARSLYLAAQRLLATPLLQPVTPLDPVTPEFPLPDLAALQTRAALQLQKIRAGRNIAGYPRAAAITSDSGIVTQPTAHRYKTLLERARQGAAQAAQVEAEFLAALEKYAAKTLEASDAQNAIGVSAAQLGVQAARVQEADTAVSAAAAQQAKAKTMVSTYTEAIAAPPNQYETDLLGQYGQLRDLQDITAVANGAIAIAQAAARGADWFKAITTFGVAQVGASIELGAVVARTAAEVSINDLQSQMQANQLQASIENRRQEWALQQTSALQDSLVAAAQVRVAQAQVSITMQEQAVAVLQHNQARARLQFLTTQFTNADLYLWLSQTLGSVYRYFLQQATATASLAQSQLAFERAEQPQSLIREDYTKSPDELRSSAGQTGRQGLAGAEQLAQDLSRLDEYSFNSSRRTLNLSQTFSLAQLLPVEFLTLRQTGTITFTPTLTLFDQDFPGHYLRLIHQVRTSVVALVPPSRGIRASLSCNGLSTVVTKHDDAFTSVTLRQDPAVVALTAPVNATGVFELDAQSELLLPFEGAGVETSFEFRMPRAANPFDYGTLADVLITIDYTAVSDENYRSQITNALNRQRTRGGDCVFSLARDFPDQWYALNNPSPGAPRAVTVTLRDVDLPLAVTDLAVANLAVQLAVTAAPPLPQVALALSHAADAALTATTSPDGIASTRRGAAGWTRLLGANPVGEWQLSLDANADPLFATGQCTDLIVILSWTGLTPIWPT